MQVVILCGGKGTRLAEETSLRPKPMVTIGDRPILWHIMKLYSSHGFENFTLAAGYLADHIKNYFLNYNALNSDFEVDLGSGAVKLLQKPAEVSWKVRVVDTGHDTLTGGRLLRLRPFLEKSGTFLFTYGDGLCDVDIKKLLDFHKSHGKLCTVTAIQPTARFGGLDIDSTGSIRAFREKRPDDEGWVNGGFMVMEPGVFKYLEDDQTTLERTPMERMAAEGQLMAYEHKGFWQCMDTLRDRNHLEELWVNGKAPWKRW